MSNHDMSSTEPTVYTIIPTVHQRQRMQWRIAYVRVVFDDATTGVIALATAPMLYTPERLLRDTADLIVRGMMATYPTLDTLNLAVLTETYRDVDGMVCTSLVSVDALTNFERKHTVECSALYFQMPFLERLEIAYGRVANHTEEQTDAFSDALTRIWRATATTIEQEEKEQADYK